MSIAELTTDTATKTTIVGKHIIVKWQNRTDDAPNKAVWFGYFIYSDLAEAATEAAKLNEQEDQSNPLRQQFYTVPLVNYIIAKNKN